MDTFALSIFYYLKAIGNNDFIGGKMPLPATPPFFLLVLFGKAASAVNLSWKCVLTMVSLATIVGACSYWLGATIAIGKRRLCDRPGAGRASSSGRNSCEGPGLQARRSVFAQNPAR